MKIRNGFISNSSTSSFVCVGYGFEEELKLKQIQKAFKLKNDLMWKCLVALNKKYKEKRKLMMQEKYGVDNPMQCAEIAMKTRRYKRKEYFFFPSGRKISVQGYEPFALDVCEDNDYKFKLIFCDFHSARYENYNPHASARLAQFLYDLGYRDGEEVKGEVMQAYNQSMREIPTKE